MLSHPSTCCCHPMRWFAGFLPLCLGLATPIDGSSLVQLKIETEARPAKKSEPTASLAAGTDNDFQVAQAEEWLTQHSYRPAPPEEYRQHNAFFAMRARREVPAVKDVPEDLFQHEVLPYQHFDEPLDDWRGDFFTKLTAQPSVQQATSLKELAEAVIPLTFTSLGNKVEFKSNMTPQVMAPISETLAQGHASCTGMSILVANALRSVGVPARIAGVTEWNRKSGGNHNWVEAWLGDGWHFFDAVPTDKVTWDSAWFTDGTIQKAEAGGIHGVYSPAWDQSDAKAKYTVTWRTPSIELPAIDRTEFYKAIPLPK